MAEQQSRPSLVNANVGRFTTVDPIRDGSNWYAYVNGDPINRIDLWGLCGDDYGYYVDFMDPRYSEKDIIISTENGILNSRDDENEIYDNVFSDDTAYYVPPSGILEVKKSLQNSLLKINGGKSGAIGTFGEKNEELENAIAKINAEKQKKKDIREGIAEIGAGIAIMTASIATIILSEGSAVVQRITGLKTGFAIAAYGTALIGGAKAVSVGDDVKNVIIPPQLIILGEIINEVGGENNE